jgi:hypothetical protein
MHERHLEAEHPLPRLAVDQLGTSRGELSDRGPHVFHLVRNVMHARTTCREKPPDGRIVTESGQELDPAVADADRRRLDALIVDAGTMLQATAEEALVRTHRFVEVHDRNADMVNALRFHVSDATAVAAEGVASGRFSTSTWAGAFESDSSPSPCSQC